MTNPSKLLAVLFSLSLACSSGQEPGGTISATDLQGRWLIDYSVSDGSLSCTFRDIILDMTATDSIHLHAIYGPGLVTCLGHGFTAADTMIAIAQVADTVVLNGDRITIAHNVGLDTLAGGVAGDLTRISGSAVNRGTVASDGYHFTMRGQWTATLQPAAP